MLRVKVYTILFTYIFLFASLGAVYSDIIGDQGVYPAISVDDLAARNYNSGNEYLTPAVIPKVQAAVPIEEFVLIIPSIGLEEEVIENIDPVSPEIYMPVLNEHIAHGKYTRMPDGAVEDGNVYLFAHREWQYQGRNSGFFAKIDQLSVGDMAIIKYNGQNYYYKFRSREVVDVKNVSVYTDVAPSPTLTLQTCEGSQKRLIVSFDLTKIL
ncbi:sortase [Candidatus Dojkabacteria bacterium]|nr:sortase [Candidatus Dojkabacteria bacterium]